MAFTLLKNRDAVDPVCGMHVDRMTNAPAVCHERQEFFFCSTSCRTEFESNPEKYTSATTKPKGFWQRYLDRITRISSGGPKPCH